MFRQSNNLFWWTLLGVFLLLASINVVKLRQKTELKPFLENDKAIANFSFGKIKLFLKDDAWFLDSAGVVEPADTQNIDNFIAKAKKLVMLQPLSTNKESFGRYGINDQSPVLDIGGIRYMIGDLGDKFDTTYISPVGSGKIYEVNCIWGNKEPGEIKYWDKRIATNLPLLQIEKVDVGTSTLLPKNGQWSNQAWIEKVSFLKAGKYLGKVRPNGDVYKYKVYFGKEEKEIVFSANWVEIFPYYYELDSKDFELLTSVLPKR